MTNPKLERKRSSTVPERSGGPSIALAAAALSILAAASVVLAGQGLLHSLASGDQGLPESIVTTSVDGTPVIRHVTGEVLVTAGYARKIMGPATSGAIYTRDGIDSGQSVNVGAVLAVVNERPIIALAGDIPAYRSLGLGSVGEDVSQLQRNLNELGYATPTTGAFTSSTAKAVWELFQARGFPPVDASGSPVLSNKRAQAVVPMGSIYFLPAFPAVARTSCGVVGEALDTSVCTLEGGKAVLGISIAAVDVPLVTLGMRVDVDLVDGTSLAGTVSAFQSVTSSNSGQAEEEGSSSGSNNTQSNSTIVIEVKLEGDPVLDYGLTGRASIVISESAPSELGVEAIAIRSDDAGDSWLVGLNGERISVTVGDCGAGRCVVEGQGVDDGLVVQLSGLAVRG